MEFSAYFVFFDLFCFLFAIMIGTGVGGPNRFAYDLTMDTLVLKRGFGIETFAFW